MITYEAHEWNSFGKKYKTFTIWIPLFTFPHSLTWRQVANRAGWGPTVLHFWGRTAFPGSPWGTLSKRCVLVNPHRRSTSELRGFHHRSTRNGTTHGRFGESDSWGWYEYAGADPQSLCAHFWPFAWMLFPQRLDLSHCGTTEGFVKITLSYTRWLRMNPNCLALASHFVEWLLSSEQFTRGDE